MIAYLKLISGTEIVGRIDKETDDNVTMFRPMSFSFITKDDGNGYFQLLPHSIVSDNITFSTKFIVERSTYVIEQIKKLYEKLLDGPQDEITEDESDDEEEATPAPSTSKRVFH